MTPQVARALVVDDDDVAVMLYRRVIERSGLVARIEVASDGQAALDILSADRAAGIALPDVVFLDINMPVMGGLAFLDHFAPLGCRLREAGVAAPRIVVMVSMSLLARDHARLVSDPNVHSLCEKPLRADRLSALVAGLGPVG